MTGRTVEFALSLQFSCFVKCLKMSRTESYAHFSSSGNLLIPLLKLLVI